jgi:hypothetical protein
MFTPQQIVRDFSGDLRFAIYIELLEKVVEYLIVDSFCRPRRFRIACLGIASRL